MIKVLMALLLHTLLFADIDAEIEKIQHASVSERFKMMNAFKQKLIQMREKERFEAIKKLKKIAKNPHLDTSSQQKIIQNDLVHEEISHAIAEEIEHEREDSKEGADDD